MKIKIKIKVNLLGPIIKGLRHKETPCRKIYSNVTLEVSNYAQFLYYLRRVIFARKIKSPFCGKVSLHNKAKGVNNEAISAVRVCQCMFECLRESDIIMHKAFQFLQSSSFYSLIS